MSTMNISLPDSLKSFVDEQVSQRGYGTSSEYVRELIRKDQDRARLRALLRRAIELARVLVLAEVRAVVKFLQQHQLGTTGGGFGDTLIDAGEVGGGVALVEFLDEGDFQDAAHASRPAGSCMVMQCRLPFCQISGRQGTGTMVWFGKALPKLAAAAASIRSP